MLRKWRSGAGLIFSLGLILAMFGAATFASSQAVADTYNSTAKVTSLGDNTLNWTGQGTSGGSLSEVQCDSNYTPYLLWIFTFGNATISSPALHLGGSGSGNYTGTLPSANASAYHFTTGYFSLSTLTANVTFNASALGNNGSEMNLTISHGCPGAPPKANVNVSTVVFDATTNAAWAGTEEAGASAYDTSRVVAPSAIPVPTGTVTYTFFTNNTCAGDGTSAGTKTLAANGTVPVSDTKSTLSAGAYAFRATYSGDSHYNTKTSDCEPFTVAAAPSKTNVNVSTIVFDDATDKALVDLKLAAGGSVYDTSRVVAPSVIPVPTGTVTYTFFTNNTCAGDGTGAGTKTLAANGTVPISDTKSALAAGSYAFKATYSGDGHYNGNSSDCEPFTVTAAPEEIKVELCHADANSNQPYGPKPIEVSINSVGDAEGVRGHGDHKGPVFPATGTDGKWGDIIPPFTYGDFTYPGLNWDTAGQAIFNNGCAIPVKVNVNVTTIVFDATTDEALVDLKLAAGGSVYDTSRVVAPSVIPVPTGTVTYTFFTNNNCAGEGSDAGTKTLAANGTVPISDTKPDLGAGAYAFRATYNGDSHYNTKTSDCEPFTMTASSKDPTSVATQSSETGDGVEQGDSVTDTATVTNITPGGGPMPTGSIQFKISFENGPAVDVGGPVALDANGKATSNAINGTTTPNDTALGTYCWQAFFTATGNFQDSSETSKTNECFTRKDPTDVATQSSTTSNDVEAGTSVTDTATLTNITVGGGPMPTGAVQFKISFNGGPATVVGATKTIDATGHATSDAFNVTTQTPYGQYCWQAFFEPTGFFKRSSETNDFAHECFSVSGPYVSPTPSPTGGVLAATGATPPTQDLAIFLIALGFLTMTAGAFAWRRREA